MANYFTHFSCLFDVGPAGNAEHALKLYEQYALELARTDAAPISFDVELRAHNDNMALWIYDPSSGDPDEVIEFVIRCARAFNLQGRWGFACAHSCSRPRVNRFGGTAYIIDLGARECVESIDCHAWMESRLCVTKGGVS